MPKSVECQLLSCFWNDQSGDKCGKCTHEEGIVLKWRVGLDLGRGSMILVECMNFTLPDGEIKL